MKAQEIYNFKKPTKATDLTDVQLHQAANTMFAYGGGFAGTLAEAFFKADSTNREKLLVAFDELFMRYHRWNVEDNK